ncbi:MAG: phosphomannomutase/phosphoglucomutase [Proteobacteria bacterium]|nr:phosphomannomutase/phosphoglucomutase [Pseudomonadota bacterium]
MGIFKAYDIRGLYPEELDSELARRIGNAFARFLGAGKLVVGQDMRTHSPELAEAVSAGIRDAGCNVIRLGLASTPMTYYAIGSLDCDGGLCVTASHNPGQYNGLKLCREDAKPISGDTGIGDIERLCGEPYPEPGPQPGSESSVNLLVAYADHVAGFAHLARPVKIAIDAANGMAGHTLPMILERVPALEAHTMLMEPDGTFPNHEADPLKEKNLDPLRELVRASGAELGVSFDGDADRCCFVDETGTTVPADLMTGLLAPGFALRGPGTPIVYDLRSSWAVREEIERSGGTPIRERVGHSFIKATMRERDAVFAGELSGHFYFADNFTTDSGVIAMMSVLSLLAAEENAGRTFSAIVAGLKRYHSTGEINFRVDDKAAAIAALKSEFADGRQDELDGLTVEYGDLSDDDWWWFNVRASNTEPLLRLNLEARTSETRDRRREQLIAMLGEPV